ncbi:MAG: hypothetical protein HYV46_09365, partial [candidate division NC10 bacterium]|nr:hypothetical protein [candidate division NC10 bacterium]
RDLWTRELEVERVNLIAIERLSEPRRVLAKVRYAQEPAAATVIPLAEDRVRLCFDEPQRAVAPGQAAVFYDESDPDLVVGGGTIRRGEQRTTANCGMANAECGIGIGEDAIRGGGGGVRRPPP